MGMGKRRGKGERKEDFYTGIGKKAIKDRAMSSLLSHKKR